MSAVFGMTVPGSDRAGRAPGCHKLDWLRALVVASRVFADNTVRRNSWRYQRALLTFCLGGNHIGC